MSICVLFSFRNDLSLLNISMMKIPFVLLLLFSFSKILFAQNEIQEFQLAIHFDFNKYEIPDTSLLKVVKILATNDIERVLLEGHCDSVGSKDYNYILSNQRANEVKKLLMDNGVEKNNIKQCIGFGKDKPLTLNANEMERLLNRRVIATFYVKEKSKVIPIDTVIAKVVLDKNESEQVKKIVEAKVGDQIILENLLFIPGRHFIKEESYNTLQHILSAMQSHPSLAIEIQGHVCCTTYELDGYDWDTGTDNLSEMRARQIYLFLIKNGIEKDRMSYKGFGGQKKLYEEETDEYQKSLNRRVEIKILKK